MIKLSVESYCHNCAGFVPIVTTERTKKHVEYIVRCQSFARCKTIKEGMKKMGAEHAGGHVEEITRCGACAFCEIRNNDEPICHKHYMIVDNDYYCADGVKGEWMP